MFFLIVFYPVVRHEEEISGSAPCSSSSSADLQFSDASSQTDDRNYRLETMAMKQKYDKEIRKLSRDSRVIRIRYGKQSNWLVNELSNDWHDLNFLTILIDWLIVYCLTSHSKYFIHRNVIIADEIFIKYLLSKLLVNWLMHLFIYLSIYLLIFWFIFYNCLFIYLFIYSFFQGNSNKFQLTKI